MMVKPRRTRRTEFMAESRNMLVRRSEEETPHGDLGLGVRILKWKIWRKDV
jgi:hypothetical protein